MKKETDTYQKNEDNFITKNTSNIIAIVIIALLIAGAYFQFSKPTEKVIEKTTAQCEDNSAADALANCRANLEQANNKLNIMRGRENALGEQYFDVKNQLTDCQNQLQNTVIQPNQKEGIRMNKAPQSSINECITKCNKAIRAPLTCEDNCNQMGDMSEHELRKFMELIPDLS